MSAISMGMATLSDRNFSRLASFIEKESGIRMPPTKRSLVEGRLRRRVRALGLNGLDDYCRYVFEHGGLDTEAIDLIDAVTTNKTDFFREPEHFTFLAEKALPRLADRPLKVWSVASSIGAEPYTLAMVLSDYGTDRRGFRFEVLSTDICTDVLKRAVLAIYPEEMLAPVPPEVRRRHFRRAKDPARREVRVCSSTRRHVRFARLNLMDEQYPVDHDIDVIFCRNVLIYFDKATQHAVLSRLCRHLRPGGFLFLGHSETVGGFALPLVSVANSVFLKTAGGGIRGGDAPTASPEAILF